MENRKRLMAGAVLCVCTMPMLFGAECMRAKIGLPFSIIELRQGCPYQNLPGVIKIAKLDDDTYELDLADIVEADESVECGTEGTFAIDGEGCFMFLPLTTRILTAEEMQRVDDVVAILEADFAFRPERLFDVCGIEVCGPTTTRVNNHYFSDSTCGVVMDETLTPESEQALLDLWESFRN